MKQIRWEIQVEYCYACSGRKFDQWPNKPGFWGSGKSALYSKAAIIKNHPKIPTTHLYDGKWVVAF
jgi:hypothetical protein